jgi:hypothetical protein
MYSPSQPQVAALCLAIFAAQNKALDYTDIPTKRHDLYRALTAIPIIGVMDFYYLPGSRAG